MVQPVLADPSHHLKPEVNRIVLLNESLVYHLIVTMLLVSAGKH